MIEIIRKDGFYPNMPSSEYHSQKDYLGSGSLRELAFSPNLFWLRREQEQELTDAMRFGLLVHAILEGNTKEYGFVFESEHFQLPINRRKKEYQEWKKKIQTDGGIIVTAEEENLLAQLVFALRHSPIAKLLDGNILREASFFCELEIPEFSMDYESDSTDLFDRRTVKVKTKARPDVLNLDHGIIIDYKTVSIIPTERNMNNWILHNRYDIQAGLYSLVLEQFTGQILPFLFIFLQKTEPYEIGWMIIQDDQLEIAREEAKTFLAYAHWFLTTDNRQGISLYWKEKIPRFQYSYIPETQIIPKK